MSSPTIGAVQHGTATFTMAVPLRVHTAVALGTVMVSLLLALAGAPALLAQTRVVCDAQPCGWAQLPPESTAGLGALGLSLESWAVCWLAVNLLYVLVFCGVAASIAVKRPDEPMAILGCVALASFGATFCELGNALSTSEPAWRLPYQMWSFVGAATLLSFFFLFPNGRFVPRWTRWAIPTWVVLSGVAFLSTRDWSITNNGPWFLPLALAFCLAVIGAQVYRYWRVSSSLERQQTKWVVAGFTTAFGSFFLLLALVVPHTRGADPGSVLAHLAVELAFPFLQLLLPVSVIIAILRYRLWDIDVLVSRALVYAGLTACVVAVYVGVVGYLGALLHTTDNLVVSVTAAGVVAVLFQPARQRLQRLVNRLVYGERDDPYAVLSRLGQRLEAVLEPGRGSSGGRVNRAGHIPCALRRPDGAVRGRRFDAGRGGPACARPAASAADLSERSPGRALAGPARTRRDMVRRRSTIARRPGPPGGCRDSWPAHAGRPSARTRTAGPGPRGGAAAAAGRPARWPGASAGDEAVALTEQLEPDIVLMDLKMPGGGGVESTRQIVATRPTTRVLVVTMFEDDASVFAAMRAGARGYVLKDAQKEELLRAVRAVGSGEAIFSSGIAARVVEFFRARAAAAPASFPQLTDREREILQLMVGGASNAEVARTLGLSGKTIANYVSVILNKLEVADRAAAIGRAREAGLG